MTWVQRGISPPSYELLCDGKSLGSLGWVEESSTAALMEAAGRFFILRKAGLLSQRVVVETLTKRTVARISLPSLARAGQLRLPRGERYSFAFNGSLEWTDSRGRFVARVGPDAGRGEVTENHQVPLLLLFAGWYLHRTLGKGSGLSGSSASGAGSA